MSEASCALVEGQRNRCKAGKKLNVSCVWRMVHVVLRNGCRDNPQLNQTINDNEMLLIPFIVHEFQMQFSLSKERNNITHCITNWCYLQLQVTITVTVTTEHLGFFCQEFCSVSHYFLTEHLHPS